jgi:hypothetical protein
LADGGGDPISDLVGAFAIGPDNDIFGFDTHARGFSIVQQIWLANLRQGLIDMAIRLYR